jgi:hypothetical protein
MSQLDNIKEQLRATGSKIGSQIQESPTYSQAQDRFESLSPSSQKLVWIVGTLIVLFVLVFYPVSNLLTSQSTLAMFEEKRNLVRELFRTYREASSAPTVAIPPNYESLKASVASIINKADLTPEQNLGSIEANTEGKLIPPSLVSHALEVKLAKLNLKQIVDIGTSLVAISESVKMKDLLIRANAQDTRYFDVTYKLYSLNVPEPTPEAPPEPEPRNNKAKENN